MNNRMVLSRNPVHARITVTLAAATVIAAALSGCGGEGGDGSTSPRWATSGQGGLGDKGSTSSTGGGAPLAPTHSGLISIGDFAIHGAPQAGHGLSVQVLLTAARAPVYQEVPGQITGCKVWSYDVESNPAPRLTNQGVVAIQGFKDGPITCSFKGTGYVCPVASGSGQASVTPGPTGATEYTVEGAAFSKADVGRYLQVAGSVSSGNDGSFPIVAVSLATKVVVVNKKSTTEMFAASYTVDDPGGRIEIERLFDLWSYLGKTLDDPSLPIRVAEKTTIEDLEVLGFAMMTAPSLRQALGTATRYFPLLSASGRWEVTESARRVHVRWYRLRTLTLGHRMSNETAVAQCLVCLRQIVGHLDPIEVTFRHAAPRIRAAHGAFFRCPVRFEAPYDGLSFHRELLDDVPISANPRLWDHLCKSADSLAEQLSPRSIVEAVSHQIVRELSSAEGGVPSLTEVARALGTTERTLRRRLTVEESSFRELVEGARRERAGSLLEGATATVTETALKLGFSDTTAFTHACQRWFGCAPRELRARLRAPTRPPA